MTGKLLTGRYSIQMLTKSSACPVKNMIQCKAVQVLVVNWYFVVKDMYIQVQLLFKSFSMTLYGPQREKTCLRGLANNTGADQPAHPRSLISAFVIRFLKSVISKLATSEILVF